MKKTLLTLFTLCLTALTATAQTYTENIVVTVNGSPADPTPANITVVRNSDNTACEFSLKDFILVDGETTLAVGNITLQGVTMENKGSYYALNTTQTIQISEGDSESPTGMWLGPILGDVPIVLSGKLTDTQLYANLDIAMSEDLVVNVVVGDATTAIHNVTTSTLPAAMKGVYTLGGVRVASKWNASLPKGVYIVNGKKVIK